MFAKELSLDAAEIPAVPAGDLRKYPIPDRRPATRPGRGVLRRLADKCIQQALADFTVLIISCSDLTRICKDGGSEYGVKELLLSDGERGFDFSLRGAEATGARGSTIAVGDSIALITTRAKFDPTDNAKLIFALAKETEEVLVDKESPRARELLAQKGAIFATRERGGLPYLISSFEPDQKRVFFGHPMRCGGRATVGSLSEGRHRRRRSRTIGQGTRKDASGNSLPSAVRNRRRGVDRFGRSR